MKELIQILNSSAFTNMYINQNSCESHVKVRNPFLNIVPNFLCKVTYRKLDPIKLHISHICYCKMSIDLEVSRKIEVFQI